MDITDSFKAISKLALNPYIKKVEYTDLIDTDEKCIEWHAWYQDIDGETWQIDMIQKGSCRISWERNIIIYYRSARTKKAIPRT